jgi:hypothetical protein
LLAEPVEVTVKVSSPPAAEAAVSVKVGTTVAPLIAPERVRVAESESPLVAVSV